MSGLLPLFLSVREQRQFCMEPKSALPYFYAVKRFRGQSPRYKNGPVSFGQTFMPEKPYGRFTSFLMRHLSPAVIPAQSGIQSSSIQNYLKIVIISNFWIPTCAGMTTRGFLT